MLRKMPPGPDLTVNGQQSCYHVTDLFSYEFQDLMTLIHEKFLQNVYCELI
jgi:hypothetical protein